MAMVCAKIHHYHCRGKYLKARRTPAAGMPVWMAALRYSWRCGITTKSKEIISLTPGFGFYPLSSIHCGECQPVMESKAHQSD